jgi:predicted RNA-binding protein YlxR (DUF448 family)
MARPKQIPMRRCVVCRTSRPKAELVRWVRTPGGIAVDATGRAPGRGAYICAAEPCLRGAISRKGIERVLGGRPSEPDIERLLAAGESAAAPGSGGPRG